MNNDELDLQPPRPDGVSPCCGKRWVWSAETRGRHDGTQQWRCFGCNRVA